MIDYLEVKPGDSNADAILCQMLPDYKAEIRRVHVLGRHKGDVNFSKLPIVVEAESYLRNREAERGGQERATQGHHAVVVRNRAMLRALMEIKNYEVGESPDTSGLKSYMEVIQEIKAIASKAISECVLPPTGQRERE